MTVRLSAAWGLLFPEQVPQPPFKTAYFVRLIL